MRAFEENSQQGGGGALEVAGIFQFTISTPKNSPHAMLNPDSEFRPKKFPSCIHLLSDLLS